MHSERGFQKKRSSKNYFKWNVRREFIEFREYSNLNSTGLEVACVVKNSEGSIGTHENHYEYIPDIQYNRYMSSVKRVQGKDVQLNSRESLCVLQHK